MEIDSVLGENFLPSLQRAAISLDAHMISSMCALKESKRVPEKIYFDFSDYAKAFDCVDHQKMENSERGGNTRPPYQPPEKSVCRSRSNEQIWRPPLGEANPFLPNRGFKTQAGWLPFVPEGG